jgi:transcriptional regulator with XRE-family HTH domain
MTTKTGNTIKQARKSGGFTQQDLAFLSGLSEPQIARIETGRRDLSEDEAEMIAKILMIDPATITEADHD